MIEPKAVAGELTRKYYGPDTPTQAKNLKTGSVLAIKSFVQLPDGQLVDEEIVEELSTTIKTTREAIAAAWQMLAGGAASLTRSATTCTTLTSTSTRRRQHDK